MVQIFNILGTGEKC